jgi:integrase/recombinase XerD
MENSYKIEFISSSAPTLKKNIDRNKIYFGFLHNFSSPHTRDAYSRDLKKYLQFLSDQFRKVDEFSAEHAHVVAFKELLIKEDYSLRSINRILAGLWSFYDYLMDLNLIGANPVARIKRFRVEKEVTTEDLKNQEVLLMIDSIDTSNGSGKLHRALLTLFFTTGMRHSEVTHLKFKNLDEVSGLTVIKYRAKGSKEMITPLNPKAEIALSDYLNWCESQGYSMGLDDYIFRPTKNPIEANLNRPLDPKSLRYIFKKYAKKVGITSHVTPHSARSTVIGMLLDKGHGLERVADFVGHKDISMTKAYNKRRSKLQDSLSLDL